LRKNSPSPLPFILIAIYRFVCLVLTGVFYIILPAAGNDHGKGRAGVFLMYLATSTVLFTVLRRHRIYFLVLVMVDYFSILMYQYADQRFAFLEFLWMPSIMCAVSMVIQNPAAFLFPLILGIPGCVFFSDGYFSGSTLSLGGIACPYRIAAFFFYVPVTLLSVMAGWINLWARKAKENEMRLDKINFQLNKITKDITRKLFGLQNDMALEERKKISKEIHDAAGYIFTNLIMMLQAASAVLGRDTRKAEAIIINARDYAEKGINEIRHILRNIRGHSHGFLSLQNTLFDLADSFRMATNITLVIEYGNWPRTFSKTINSFLVSFTQECLTNALRHGQATSIGIMCWMRGPRIFMRVTDNGRGALMPIKKGIGISAMEEFVVSYDGGINIRSDEGGFTITAELLAEKKPSLPATVSLP
jgi:signal transduction histidine kinase